LDDAIHSNVSVVISGGNLTISAGDDGIHADASLKIAGGDINITKSYEGIESANITIDNGTIHLTSSDDGLNGAGGVDSSSINGRAGQNTFATSGTPSIAINGGYLVVNSTGDGIDVNGALSMTNGVVIVNGPTASGNGALDFDKGFKMTGGYLLAVGAAGMAQAPDTSSTQNALLLNLTSSQQAGTLIHIASQSGEDILTFTPAKSYQSIVLCSPKLQQGSTYTVSLGGSSTGKATDGLYTGGSYTAGTKNTDFTVSSVVTTVGAAGGMQGGMRSRPQ
jgi:hypothetical protein